MLSPLLDNISSKPLLPNAKDVRRGFPVHADNLGLESLGPKFFESEFRVILLDVSFNSTDSNFGARRKVLLPRHLGVGQTRINTREHIHITDSDEQNTLKVESGK